MYPSSSLTAEQRLGAVGLFEQGLSHDAVASRLGVSRNAVRRLEDRFKIWGRAALDRKPTKQVYSFEFKLALVRQFLDGGGTLPELARMHQLSSPKLLAKWIQSYREQGEDGLRPRTKGRPRATAEPSGEVVSELEQLRRENQRLQAENAYLKKVRASRNQPRS